MIARTFAPAGDMAPVVLPGDFVLVHGDQWQSKIIRFGQRLRFRGDDRVYAHWNHAALVVSSAGDLVEATGAGVVRSHLDDYKGHDYVVVSHDNLDSDRQQAIEFASRRVGDRYGFVTIVCVGLALLFGGKVTFGFQGQCICSGLVARAMERCGADYDRLAEDITPADLARYYHVQRVVPA